MPLEPGAEFPNLKLESVDGRVELRQRWQSGPLVVMFMRHFGCAFCREHLIKTGRAIDEFRAAGAEVVAIFQYSADATRDFCASRKVPFDCLGDPLRAAYAEVDVQRGTRKQSLNRRIARRYLGVIARERVVGGPSQGGDMLQLPGTFVVGSDGRVLFAHYAVSSADTAPVADLLAAVRSQGVSAGSA
jgi:peroxiredoxin